VLGIAFSETDSVVSVGVNGSLVKIGGGFDEYP